MKSMYYLADAELSWKAKGLLRYMEEYGTALALEDLLPLARDGYTSVQNGLHELADNNYYNSAPIRDNKGQYIAFRQYVRFSIRRPQYQLEKDIINAVKTTTRLSDHGVYIVKSALSVISEDQNNLKELIIEVNDLKELGYENAEIVLKALD